MRFIKLPTIWDTTDPQLAELGIGSENLVEGFIYINIDQICAINESTATGESALRMSDGNVYRVILDVRQLKIELENG